MVLCLLLLLLVMRPALYGGWKAYVFLQRYPRFPKRRIFLLPEPVLLGCFFRSHELPLQVTALSASPVQTHQRHIVPYSSRTALDAYAFPPFFVPTQISSYCTFAAAAFLALSAFFLLLLIMTTLRKLPTTAPPTRRRMTGMRMAQTRGGKSCWIGCESSTNGWDGY